jgi:hypothetical protein
MAATGRVRDFRIQRSHGSSFELHGCADGKTMATDRFKEEVIEELKRFEKRTGGSKVPAVLKVNYRDAMSWHYKERSDLVIPAFVDRVIRQFVTSLRCRGQTLQSDTELMDVDSVEQTHFE